MFGAASRVLFRWISWRRVVRAPLRSLLIAFGIALGVAALVATIAVSRSIRVAFDEMAERVAGRADLVITAGEIGVDPELVAAIDDVDGVLHAAGTVEIITQIEKKDGPILLLGVDFLGDRYFLPLTALGEQTRELLDDPLSFLNDPQAILLSASLARRRHLEVGSQVELLTPAGKRPFVVRGLLEDTGLAKAFGGQLAVMFQDAALAAFGRDKIDRVEVAVEPDLDLEVLKKRIEARVAGQARVERPEGRARHLSTILLPIERGLAVAGALALLVGMFVIYNAVGVAVAQRRREIGILRALGATRREITILFTLEAMALGLLGSLLGLGLAALISDFALAETAPPISRFWGAIRAAPPGIDGTLASIGVGVGVLVSLLSALWPARLAAGVDPAEALHRQALVITRRPVPHRKLFFGTLLLLVPAAVAASFPKITSGYLSLGFVLAAGVLALPMLIVWVRRLILLACGRLLPVPIRLAVDRLAQRLDRSTVIVGALMLSVSSTLGLGSWGEAMERAALGWLDRALPADLYVTAGSVVADQQNVPFGPEVMDQLVDLPGASQVYPLRLVQIDVQDRRILLIALDSVKYFSALAEKAMAPLVVEGMDPIPREALLDKPKVLISENAARRLGLHPSDQLTLTTRRGPQPFEVLAVVTDYTSDLGSIVMERRWYQELFGDPLIDTIDISLLPGGSLPEVRAEIQRRLPMGEDLFVVSAQDMREEIKKVLVDALAIFRSTELVALVVALMGVIGMLLASVLDRTREIGVLRAIGASRHQVVVSVVAEGALLGLVAVIGGLLAGVPMGWVFTRVVALASTGWQFEYVFPLAIAVRVAVLVISTAGLAGLWPGRRAAAQNVPEALAYE